MGWRAGCAQGEGDVHGYWVDGETVGDPHYRVNELFVPYQEHSYWFAVETVGGVGVYRQA